MKNIVIEINRKFGYRFNRRLDIIKERISKLEDLRKLFSVQYREIKNGKYEIVIICRIE